MRGKSDKLFEVSRSGRPASPGRKKRKGLRRGGR